MRLKIEMPILRSLAVVMTALTFIIFISPIGCGGGGKDGPPSHRTLANRFVKALNVGHDVVLVKD